MRREDLPPRANATFVLARWKVVYVAVEHARSTDLKWLVAGLQGEDPLGFYETLGRDATRAATVHRRAAWRATPTLRRLSDARLARVSTDDGWFVFTVVRHPADRLFAAWQSKLLLRAPWWYARFGAEPWFPRIPRDTEEVVADFARFVGSLRGPSTRRLLRTLAFRPQVETTAADRLRYTAVYDVTRIPDLLDDLSAHLRSRGWETTLTPQVLPHHDGPPLRPLASIFTAEVRERLAEIYAADFERFGYEATGPEKVDPAERYDDRALREVARLVARNERLDDVLRAVRLERRRAKESRRADVRPRSPRARAARLARRLRRRARARLYGVRS